MTAAVALVADETKTSIAAVCRALELSRSTVYARRSRPPSARDKATACLDVEVRAVFSAREQRYGSPRIHRELRRRGLYVGRKRVEARMRVLGLQARRPKRFRRTTEANPAHVPAPNLLDRRFDWDQPNRAWVGDISFVWTAAGWAYLAILVDLCTRSIVGWAVGKSCDAALAKRALDNAVARHRPPPGLLHHTDRGSTYTAQVYRDAVKAYGMVESMSRRGNCWDNGVPRTPKGDAPQEMREWPLGIGLQGRIPNYVELLR